MKTLNTYGDQASFLASGHGADIASQRADDLDQMAIDHARERESPFAIDIGCGAGGQSIRLAQQGASVIATDILDMRAAVTAAAARSGLTGKISFIQIDMRSINQLKFAIKADIINCQRAIHYLRFEDAIKVIAMISAMLAPDGKLYISASGIQSELGDRYAGVESPLNERFAELTPVMRDKHGIHAPVCLYSENDMANLLTQGGLTPQSVFSSAFGNIKAVAKHAA